MQLVMKFHRNEITVLAPCYSQLGIATHYVPSRSIPQLLDRLSRLEHANYSIIDMTIEEFYEAPSPDAVALNLVGRVRQALDHAFSAGSVPGIVERLKTIVEQTGGEGTKGGWAQETLSSLAARSPTSLAVAHEANRRGRHLTLRGAFEMEMKIAKAYCVSLYLVFFFSFSSLPRDDSLCRDFLKERTSPWSVT
jgi:3-hydroxyisobutyryl-CoA hydrolase